MKIQGARVGALIGAGATLAVIAGGIAVAQLASADDQPTLVVESATPTPTSSPTPSATPSPTPEPTVEPAPAPEPTPEAVVAPEPAPVVEPEPAPVVEAPAPAPAPAEKSGDDYKVVIPDGRVLDLSGMAPGEAPAAP